MTTEFTSHQRGKMSGRGSKCPAGRCRPAGHFVRHAKNNCRDHCHPVYFLVILIKNVSHADCENFEDESVYVLQK